MVVNQIWCLLDIREGMRVSYKEPIYSLIPTAAAILTIG